VHRGIVLLALVASLAAGCGGGDDEGTASGDGSVTVQL
jgi:hypothetical protein